MGRVDSGSKMVTLQELQDHCFQQLHDRAETTLFVFHEVLSSAKFNFLSDWVQKFYLNEEHRPSFKSFP